MKERKVNTKRKAKSRRSSRHHEMDADEMPVTARRAGERVTTSDAGGPMVGLGSEQQAGALIDHADDQPERSGKVANEVESVPEISGTGESHHAMAHGNSLRLEGRTDADFDGGAFETKNVRVRRATTCENCLEGECSHVTGTLVANYHVNTTVTLPSVADIPDLSRCQQQRVRNAINTVLAPHEQEHVRAFRTYNGATRRPFDLTLCRSEFDSAIQQMFDAEESARRSAAQAASDALDPFHFDVDLDCEDNPDAGRARRQSAAEKPAAETEP